MPYSSSLKSGLRPYEFEASRRSTIWGEVSGFSPALIRSSAPRRSHLKRSGDMVLGISGASGSRLGVRALQLFASSPDVERLHLVVSPQALLVARDELGAKVRTAAHVVGAAGLAQNVRGKIVIHGESELDPSISSRSVLTLRIG